MPDSDVLEHGAAVMTVCNACRYCEQYCPVFPAMERRRVFTAGDLAYLANLCHNCGECLYACQYAPPHPFGINVPQTLAAVRLHSYIDACVPRAAGIAFRRHGPATALILTLALTWLVAGTAPLFHGTAPIWPTPPGSTFYDVLPHHALVAIFGVVSVVVLGALALGTARFWRRIRPQAPLPITRHAAWDAVRRALTLEHLHSGQLDCPSGEETRAPLRRWFHQVTMYGFALCGASTTVAAAYHVGLGWQAPYAYSSIPVVLGAAGGLGLLVGPIGLLLVRSRRDPALRDPDHAAMDLGFAVLLLLSSATGLALMAWRESDAMGVLLAIHLGSVLALLLSLPYGKFVHGIYRTAALVQDQSEGDAEHGGHRAPPRR